MHNDYEILEKKSLHKTITLMEIYAPLVAKKVMPGQFIILRAAKNGERIPLTVANYDREKGTITIIFQIVGATTILLNELKKGETITDLVGPLGKASKLNGLKKVAVIGGGVGCAIAYPIVKYLKNNGTAVDSIIGFRTKELVILQDEFKKNSTRFFIVSDDGSIGKKGFVTCQLKELVENGEKYDEVIAIGPLPMMKAVCNLTKEYSIKTTVSMNPIMIDGTGMCGGCRLSVGGETKFACVDGPDFNGHLIDFDEAIKRCSTYAEFEKKRRDETCNLFNKNA